MNAFGLLSTFLMPLSVCFLLIHSFISMIIEVTLNKLLKSTFKGYGMQVALETLKLEIEKKIY